MGGFPVKASRRLLFAVHCIRRKFGGQLPCKHCCLCAELNEQSRFLVERGACFLFRRRLGQSEGRISV